MKSRRAMMIVAAGDIIDRAEHALDRYLRDGERRDLLADNTEWDRATINAIVQELRDRDNVSENADPHS